MRQFPLSDLDIAPGRVVEWRLRCVGRGGTQGGEGACKSASFNQAKHFSVVEEARKVHRSVASWLAVTFEVPGRLDRAALERALLFFACRHEVLRCEFQRLAGDLSCDPIAADRIGLESVEVGDFDSTDELLTFLANSFHKNTDTMSWPLFVMGAVIRNDSSSTVYLAFDHIVSDGVSMPNVVNDIQAAYAAFSRGSEVELPAAGSYVDFAHEQRSRYLSIDADDERLSYWKEFMGRDAEFFPRFPLDLGVEPGCMYPTVNESDRLLGAADTEALAVRCEEAGGSLFMGLLAAVAVSLQALGGPGIYRGFMPVSERGRGSWKHSVGWFVNTLPIEFSVEDGESFGHIMAGVRASFTKMMRNIDVPFVRAWELLAPQYFTDVTWPFPVNFFSYMDMRKFPGVGHHPEWQPTAHVWAACANGTCSWFQRDAGGLYVNSIYADTPQARRTMAAVHRTVQETLQELSSTGTLRPGTVSVPSPRACAVGSQAGHR